MGPLEQMTPALSEAVHEQGRVAPLLDNEFGSDVEFLVGPEGDVWRMPAHRFMLAVGSPVFNAMLFGPLAAPAGEPIRITDVDGRAFNQLLRVLYGETPDIRSEKTCLQTLYCANKYLNPFLNVRCIEHLDTALNVRNVLKFMHSVRPFVPPGLDNSAPYAPSAPPDPEAGGAQQYVPPAGSFFPDSRDGIVYPDPSLECNMGWYCGALLYNCLQFIDIHADQVLDCEIMEDLDHEEMVMLVTRESLALKKETILFSAIDRWADRECRRNGLKLCGENKRAVLGEAVYSVRYLLMTTQELLDGPVASGILSPEESACLLGAATKQPQKVPESLRPYMKTFAEPRPIHDPKVAPHPYIRLGSRSMHPDSMGSKNKRPDADDQDPKQTKKDGKAQKKLSKKRRKEEQRKAQGQEDSRESCCTGTCFAEVFFSILASIFD